ncbi:MAG TPA: LysM peptidoglycan-binding domain-containing protein [Anaerolineales bacterium]
MPWSLAMLATACAPAPVQEVTTPTATLRSLAPTVSATLAARELLVQPTPGPSPTPLTHVVQQGDTLLGIAIRYGVELNDLLVANAGANPRFLSVGQAILIPGPEGSPAAGLLPTATPAPIELAAPACYRTLDGSLWCLTLAHNSTQAAVEGVGALITLGNASGEPLRSEPAYASLNVLAPGQRLLLAAYFDRPVPEFDLAQARLTSAVSAASLQERYALVEVSLDRSAPGPEAANWTVSGEVTLTEGGEGQVAVTLLALDGQGRPVGLTKRLVQANPTAAFELEVSSLGPPIARVELQAEAPILTEEGP